MDHNTSIFLAFTHKLRLIIEQKIEESERLLRNNRFLYDVDIKPTAYANGMVDIDVATRDTWTIDVAGNLSRSGGNNKTSFGLKEYNVLGTGLRVGISRMSDEKRKGTEFEVSYPQTFDGWTNVSYAQGRFDDGRRKSAAILRPFYALDTRWAAGATSNQDDRIDAIYNSGDTIGQYRHRQEYAARTRPHCHPVVTAAGDAPNHDHRDRQSGVRPAIRLGPKVELPGCRDEEVRIRAVPER